jgi:hypothetical protein
MYLYLLVPRPWTSTLDREAWMLESKATMESTIPGIVLLWRRGS